MIETVLNAIGNATIIIFILVGAIILIAGWYDIIVKIFWREFFRPIIIKVLNKIENHYKNKSNNITREQLNWAEQESPKFLVVGSIPTSLAKLNYVTDYASVAEWSIAPDCKSGASGFSGSNPFWRTRAEILKASSLSRIKEQTKPLQKKK